MGAREATETKAKGVKRRATVIYHRDGQILFVRKRNAKWNLPGGKVEPDETPVQAALREMAEETGLAIDQMAYLAEYTENKVIHFLFEARLTGPQKPRPCNEIDACRWFTPKELDKRNVRAAIRTLLKQCGVDERVSPAKA